MKLRPALVTLCLCLGLPACATPPSRAASVEQLIGEARCDLQSQCRTIGVGAKPCGGPAGYRAWSTRDTHEAALRSAVEREALAQREANAREGRQSNCVMKPDPGAICKPRSSDGLRTCQLTRPVIGGTGRVD